MRKPANLLKEISIENTILLIFGIILLISTINMPILFNRLFGIMLVLTSYVIFFRSNLKNIVKIYLFIPIVIYVLYKPLELISIDRNILIKIYIIFGVSFIYVALINHFSKDTFKLINDEKIVLINEIRITLTKINNYEIQSFEQECNSDIIETAKVMIKNNKFNIQKIDYNSNDYTEGILVIIANIAFNLLCTGNYHIYKGFLSSKGKNMLNVYKFCMEWAVSKNKFTQIDYNEQLNNLFKTISIMG